jgi:hypothetical protein
MGTRSITIVMSDQDRGEEKELCRIYRQFDGYPDGHGKELAELCDRRIINGIAMTLEMNTLTGEGYEDSNGMSELAAQIIMGLKQTNPIGSIYLEVPQGDINDWVEYVYIVRGKTGEKPTIECRTKTGPFPNLQTKEGLIFKGTAQEWKDHKFSEGEE